MLADVKVDLIVGEEDGHFGVDAFGLIEDVVQCLLDQFVVSLALGDGDVFPEGWFSGGFCGVDGGDVVVSCVVV